LLLVSCGDADDAPPAPTTAPDRTATVQAADFPLGSPGATIDAAVQACREKDVERLKGFVAGQVIDAQVRELFARGSDVQLGSYSWESPDERTAIASVGLLIHREGSEERVRREWELTQGDDGVWRFTALPGCY
jgi:hypothetical protein